MLDFGEIKAIIAVRHPSHYDYVSDKVLEALRAKLRGIIRGELGTVYSLLLEETSLVRYLADA